MTSSESQTAENEEISVEERAALLAKEKEDAKKRLLIAYAPWDNVINGTRKFLLFETWISFVVSIITIVVVHCILWYGSILAMQFGLLTITSVLGIFITLILWFAQKLGFNLVAKVKESQAKEPQPLPSEAKAKAEQLENKEHTEFDLRDIIDIYIETTYAADDLKTKLLSRLTSGESLGFGLVLRIIILLAIIAVVGLVIDGFWIVYFCTFLMLLSPTVITSILNRGYHKKLIKLLEPLSSRLKRELLDKTQKEEPKVVSIPASNDDLHEKHE